MGRTSNQLPVILAVVLIYLFCSTLVIGADHNHIPTNLKHEDGRRVLAGSSSLFGIARAFFQKRFPDAYQKLNGKFKKAKKVLDAAKEVIEFKLENGSKKNFTVDEAIDYLNCQCECPSLRHNSTCVQEANRKICPATESRLYCSKLQSNPSPLKCLTCSSASPPPPPPPQPSSASPLSDFVDTLLMIISTTITIIILVMNFL